MGRLDLSDLTVVFAERSSQAIAGRRDLPLRRLQIVLGVQKIRRGLLEILEGARAGLVEKLLSLGYALRQAQLVLGLPHGHTGGDQVGIGLDEIDRKSTRLNSSHTVSSYAVFCLKKKRTVRHPGTPSDGEVRAGSGEPIASAHACSV